MDREPAPLCGFSVDGTRIRVYRSDISRSMRLVFIADTHLSRDDDRGTPFREYSGRMAAAYRRPRHFRTGEEISPEESVRDALQYARKIEADLLVICGDLLSFPSEAAVEWAQAQLEESSIPYLYLAGNHDWHFEGRPGSSAELRDWGQKRLAPLYGGRDPLMTSHDVEGVRLLLIDNSTYEISPQQLEFFRSAARTQRPILLSMHIPMYVPGRPVGYGCGHPHWGARTDQNYEIERRPRWPESGHTDTTMTFHREVFSTPNLIGVFAGHTHLPTIDVLNGIPQFVIPANAGGGLLHVELQPTPE